MFATCSLTSLCSSPPNEGTLPQSCLHRRAHTKMATHCLVRVSLSCGVRDPTSNARRTAQDGGGHAHTHPPTWLWSMNAHYTRPVHVGAVPSSCREPESHWRESVARMLLMLLAFSSSTLKTPHSRRHPRHDHILWACLRPGDLALWRLQSLRRHQARGCGRRTQQKRRGFEGDGIVAPRQCIFSLLCSPAPQLVRRP